MTCTARIWGDPTGLQCKRTDPHEFGHVYVGLDAADRVHHEHDQEDHR